MRVAVLGGSGQVGRAVLGLLPAGWEVTALGRAEADLAIPGMAAAAIRALRPDAVVNAAAWTAVDAAEAAPEAARRANAEAVAEIAEAVGDGWLVHYSTDYVFDGDKPGPYDEADAPNPLNAYGRSKLEGERAVLATGARRVVLRTSWVHAPGHRNFATTMLRLAAERDSLQVVDDQTGAPTSAALIATVTLRVLTLVAAGQPPSGGLYHLAAAGATSWHGYARHVVATARAAGATLRCAPDSIRPVASADYQQAARRPANSRLDSRRLAATLGLALPDWRDGVADTVLSTLRETSR